MLLEVKATVIGSDRLDKGAAIVRLGLKEPEPVIADDLSKHLRDCTGILAVSNTTLTVSVCGAVRQ
jgi:hypothetical protein